MSKYQIVQLITVVRVPLAIALAVVLLYVPDTPSRLAIIITLLSLAEITDLLDGWLARRWKVTSEWGAMLDPYADAMGRLIVYWALACAGLTYAVVPLVMALRDVTVSYCRIIWSKQGGSVGAQWSGKVKAVVQGAGAFVLLLARIIGPWLGDPQGTLVTATMSWLVIGVTVLSGVDYARRAVELMSTRPGAGS